MVKILSKLAVPRLLCQCTQKYLLFLTFYDDRVVSCKKLSWGGNVSESVICVNKENRFIAYPFLSAYEEYVAKNLPHSKYLNETWKVFLLRRDNFSFLPK